MSYKAQALIRKLPRELKLTPTAWRVLDYLGYCANEDEAQKQGGQYFAFPSEERMRQDLAISRPTVYRALDQLEYGCGFYLITRRDCKDRRSALYDLHLYPHDLLPEAILHRKQSADMRLSLASGRNGVRKRITSQNETCLPEITSQNETCSESDHVSKRDVITSQIETETPKITSQNETQNIEGICTTGNLNQESSDDAVSDDALSRAPEPQTQKSFTAAVWSAFESLPGAKKRTPARPEKDLIAAWFAARVTALAIEIALWEGFGRRIKSPDTPPGPVHSLLYFKPVVKEIAAQVAQFNHRETALLFLRRKRQQVLEVYEQAVQHTIEKSLAPKAKVASAKGRGG